MKLNNKIFYSQIVNSTELLRSLSLHGSDAFNICVYRFKDFIEDANVKLGFIIEEKILSRPEMIEKILSFFTHGIDLKNPTFQDVEHFLQTMINIRYSLKDSEELNVFCDFCNKHLDNKSLQLLKDFIIKYFANLADDEIDIFIAAHRLIDYVKKEHIFVYDEVICFEEEKLTILEKLLLTTLSKKITSIPIISLFDDNNKKLTKIRSIYPRYGTRNEVAHVIKDIVDNKYPLDTCQIVLINKSGYINELNKFSNNLHIKMTYECGLPIILSDAYKLYSTLLQLGEKYFFDVNGYLNLFSSESFDLAKLGIEHPRQIAQLMGRMKVCFNPKLNDEYMYKFIEVRDEHPQEFILIMEKIDREIKFNKDVILTEFYHAVGEFSKGISYLIKEYTKQNINEELFHKAAIQHICDAVDYACSDKMPMELKDSFLQTISDKFLCSEVYDDSSIHITDISHSLSNYRKHTYIVGLNSSYYPGNLTQDFLFNDSSYEELCGLYKFTETSLNDKNTYLKNVINTYLNLGLDVCLSYNAQEINEVRELNPCSVLLDYAEDFFKGKNKINETEKKPDELTILKSKCSYYDDNISALNNIEIVARENKEIKEVPIDVCQKASQGVIDNSINYVDESYSPSTLPKFLKCPLRFYLDNIAGIDNTISYDNLRPMAGSRFGDLLHYVLEHLIKKAPSSTLEEILDYGSKLYDLYVMIDRSVTDDNLEKLPFLNSVENAYNFLTKNFILKGSYSEKGVGYKDEINDAKIGNIHFHGSIDLVTKDKEGNYYIVDYKTGSHIEHEENDPETCIQGLIYAQLFEKLHNIKISKLIFYYTRFNQYVVYDDPCSEESKNLLLEKVSLFENSLKNLYFPIASCDDKKELEKICKYCKYMNICHVNNNEEADEDGE